MNSGSRRRRCAVWRGTDALPEWLFDF